MNGFILAAGFGTRLKPITNFVPKALVPVGGQPLLQRALDVLGDADIDSIGVNCHYRADDLESFRKNARQSFELFKEEDSIRGTGGGLYFARDFLSTDNSFFVCNVDIVSDVSIRALRQRFDAMGCECALVAAPPATTGSILYDPDSGDYLGTSGGSVQAKGVASCDFIGMAFYRREFLDILTSEDFSVVPIWSRARERGLQVKVMLVEDLYWKDTGTLDAYAKVHFDIIDGTVDLRLPSWLNLDSVHKRVVPVSLSREAAQAVGEYVWCEENRIPAGCRLYNSIIIRSANLQAGMTIENAIVGPWGSVAFPGV